MSEQTEKSLEERFYLYERQETEGHFFFLQLQKPQA